VTELNREREYVGLRMFVCGVCVRVGVRRSAIDGHVRESLIGIVKGRRIKDRDDPLGVNCRVWPICLMITIFPGVFLMYVRGKVRDKSYVCLLATSTTIPVKVVYLAESYCMHTRIVVMHIWCRRNHRHLNACNVLPK
jgi:hypothetical protein